MRMRFFVAAAGLVLGIAAGLLAGWVFWPVEYSNVTPDMLADRYQFDYVTMIAAAYAADGDLELARGRFERLGPGGSAALLAVLAAERDDPAAQATLQQLAAGLGIAPLPTATASPTD